VRGASLFLSGLPLRSVLLPPRVNGAQPGTEGELAHATSQHEEKVVSDGGTGWTWMDYSEEVNAVIMPMGGAAL
jgi:hypothetical protein